MKNALMLPITEWLFNDHPIRHTASVVISPETLKLMSSPVPTSVPIKDIYTSYIIVSHLFRILFLPTGSEETARDINSSAIRRI